MKKFTYKKSNIEVDEANESLKIDGDAHPVRKSESGYSLYYFKEYKSLTEAAKAFIDTQE